ncbi:hypothetical protein GCM10018772_31750 [Streptomyces fumanus]|uniref:Uncharacterized protein n=1 Tax=Streptomyces fumanus TaxID=67302 RepID=A0A919AGW3_9ACTN|nr:hypothetical protein GCM10018772_31750 [Streptomyces fumanus]
MPAAWAMSSARVARGPCWTKSRAAARAISIRVSALRRSVSDGPGADGARRAGRSGGVDRSGSDREDRPGWEERSEADREDGSSSG